MPMQWHAVAELAQLAAAAKGHHKDRAPGKPTCAWPPQVVSGDRQVDFTECFELTVLLPLPILLFATAAVASIVSTSRKLRKVGPQGIDWIKRSARSERVARIKSYLFAFSALVAAACAGLSVPQIKTSPYPFVHYALLAVALAAFARLSWINHHTSRTSSTVILLFFPVYWIVTAIAMRTQILTGVFDGHTKETLAGRLVIAREALWLAALGIGALGFALELHSPEKRWAAWRAPWARRKIRLEEDEEGDTVNGAAVVREDDEAESPVNTANIFQRLTFSWLTPLLSLGTRKFLGEEDMWAVPPQDSAEALSDRLAAAWEEQVALVRAGKKREPSLKVALFKAYGLTYVIAALMKGVYDVLSFAQPQLLRLLLVYVSSYGTDAPMSPTVGFGITLLMFLTANLATALLHQYFDRCFMTTMRVKTGLITLIYRKSLRLSLSEKSGRTSGDIVNLQSVDAVRIADIAQYGNIAWSGPFQIVLAFVSLHQLVGWQAFMGVAIMVISLPINTFLSRIQKRLQRRLMGIKDIRTRLMSEILNNIKSIKLYGWETAFADKVFNARNNMELAMLRRIGIVQMCSNFFWATIPFLVAFATFSTFVYTADRPLTSEIIFPAISLFTLLSFPMSVFSNIINSIIEATVSVGRLEKFLGADELDPDARKVITPADDPKGEPSVGDKVVSIKNGEFRWIKDSAVPTLADIDIDVCMGELVAVIGRVGDGKTSLLNAILGEMNRSDGTVVDRGDIAYFSQNSWILSATVKDNIVFGHRFDPVYYDKVLDACALRSDLAVLPQGHMTEVGEKGVSLSGGQKARICLARAVYARADIYLLDDPLSAVDAHVGRHIFDHVIGPNGMLKNKARILCTNAVHTLSQVDQILMLRRGIIVERGSYDECMANQSSDVYKLITGLGKQSADCSEEGEGEGEDAVTLVPSDSGSDSAEEVEVEEDGLGGSGAELRKRRLSVSDRRASVLSIGQAKRAILRDLRESAKPKEHVEKGSVKRTIYRRYIGAAGVAGIVVFVASLALGQGSGILSNYVLRDWGRVNTRAGRNVDIPFYLTLYGVTGFAAAALNVLANVTLKLYSGLRAARAMHDASFGALMRAPLGFFEQTPTGRILNLFSRDVFVIDEVLVQALGAFARTLIQVLGVVVVVGMGAPPVLVVFVPLAVVYRMVMRYYLATSRELKRLDAVSRSPIFSFFGETLAGLPVIRAYRQQRRFNASNEARVDRNQSCYMPAMAINRWLAVRLEFLGSCLMFSTALVSVTALVYNFPIDAGLVGLLMTYTISVTGSLNWLVRSASEVEQNIVSVERVLGYTALESEAPMDIAATRPPPSWPARGDIEFDQFSMRYRPDLDLCLKDVSVHIRGGSRVGIVGRTGAGKSSMTLAIFRILEAAAGRILIDGVDISTIGLGDLRRAISIIPQDPQLFEGSLRSNIDPTNKSSDAEIWQALAQAHLKDHVMRAMGGTLDAEVSEGGSNLSSGQRQLVCFARALLRKTKILVLDEATSSIDLATDESVQTILRGADFCGVTTLTIAHRINTILDSDMVLVMDQGRVAEYDTPEALMSQPTSIFATLVDEAGLGNKSTAASRVASRAQSRVPSRAGSVREGKERKM